ncbi:hypothetical protein M3Y98_00741800 [Aphelenchoides besseyi]|nr:hypothetical protein M3Y98_00741800 [Aphelenchoides besseyi]KAI6211464.1 hypothetical protein M3Y96_00436900 [Aphelenchoides besseyi]
MNPSSSFNAFVVFVLLAVCAISFTQAAPWSPERPLYFYKLRNYDLIDPIDYAASDRVVKRSASAIKRERILDSLGGDYLIKKRDV